MVRNTVRRGISEQVFPCSRGVPVVFPGTLEGAPLLSFCRFLGGFLGVPLDLYTFMNRAVREGNVRRSMGTVKYISIYRENSFNHAACSVPGNSMGTVGNSENTTTGNNYKNAPTEPTVEASTTTT
jgi:hypothetical protein